MLVCDSETALLQANPTARSELDVLKQRITELEAENAELRKENTVIPDLRNKLLSLNNERIAELKPEIVIPNRIQKIKEFVCLVSKSFDIQTKSYKILTSEYLDWYAKLTGLPSILTDKIRSNLYKRYKKETGHEPWYQKL